MSLLKLEGINTYYGQIHILQDLTLEVNAGELVCLLGGNASGQVDDAEDDPRDRAARAPAASSSPARTSRRRTTSHRIGRGIAIVPENRRLFAPMTVLENLELGAYLHGGGAKEDYERVYTLFPLAATSAASSSRARSRAASSRWSRWPGR